MKAWGDYFIGPFCYCQGSNKGNSKAFYVTSKHNKKPVTAYVFAFWTHKQYKRIKNLGHVKHQLGTKIFSNLLNFHPLVLISQGNKMFHNKNIIHSPEELIIPLIKLTITSIMDYPTIFKISIIKIIIIKIFLFLMSSKISSMLKSL